MCLKRFFKSDTYSLLWCVNLPLNWRTRCDEWTNDTSTQIRHIFSYTRCLNHDASQIRTTHRVDPALLIHLWPICGLYYWNQQIRVFVIIKPQEILTNQRLLSSSYNTYLWIICGLNYYLLVTHVWCTWDPLVALLWLTWALLLLTCKYILMKLFWKLPKILLKIAWILFRNWVKFS